LQKGGVGGLGFCHNFFLKSWRNKSKYNITEKYNTKNSNDIHKSQMYRYYIQSGNFDKLIRKLMIARGNWKEVHTAPAAPVDYFQTDDIYQYDSEQNNANNSVIQNRFSTESKGILRQIPDVRKTERQSLELFLFPSVYHKTNQK